MSIKHCGASVSKQYTALTYIKGLSEVSDHSTQVAWYVAEQSLSLYSQQMCLTA